MKETRSAMTTFTKVQRTSLKMIRTLKQAASWVFAIFGFIGLCALLALVDYVPFSPTDPQEVRLIRSAALEGRLACRLTVPDRRCTTVRNS